MQQLYSTNEINDKNSDLKLTQISNGKLVGGLKPWKPDTSQYETGNRFDDV